MDKIINILLILVILVVGFVFINNNRKEVGYQKMKPAEAKEILESNKKAVLLDVRTPEEYREGHIKGSKLIPLDVLAQKVEGAIKDKDTTVIIYCRSGNRSRTAANSLLRMGYKNVHDLGGIISWPYGITR